MCKNSLIATILKIFTILSIKIHNIRSFSLKALEHVGHTASKIPNAAILVQKGIINILNEADNLDVLAHRCLPGEDAAILLLVKLVNPIKDIPKVNVFYIDAGPFPTVSEATTAVQRCLSNYWECHRLEEGGNSCFEFGGCHRQCWWRQTIQRALYVDIDCVGNIDCCDQAFGYLKSRKMHTTQCDDKDKTFISLVACFIEFENMIYCGLREKK